MLDFAGLQGLVDATGHAPLFVTVSGAHLYGFPSPDSDIDLRGCHLAPLRDLLALDPPEETVELKLALHGQEVELVSHDIGKYLRLLAKNNGYVLEQIYSPLVVCGADFLAKLRPLAQRCITKHHYHHYRGFLATQRKMLEKQEPKEVKTLLYAYRVLLSGIHLLRTGEVDAHLPRLADQQGLAFIPELIALKQQEKSGAPGLDWPFHDRKLTELEAQLDGAFQASTLPEDRDRRGVSEFLVELRMRMYQTSPETLG